MISNEKAHEGKQNDMKYKSELDEALKRNIIYENKIFKAHALLCEHCAKAMKNKLMSRSDCASDIHNNPINLLKAIKEHSLTIIKKLDTKWRLLPTRPVLCSVRKKEEVKVCKIKRDDSKLREKYYSYVNLICHRTI